MAKASEDKLETSSEVGKGRKGRVEEYESGRRTHGYMVKYRAMAVSQPSVY